MSKPSGSYGKVFYTLRPAKQVERRMIIETLQRLIVGGFPILDYQYTGLGSVYFVDFILFHRYLGIKKLLCAEHDLRIEKRMEFNKPYGLIEVVIKPISDVVTQLNTKIKHILWLDYDFPLDNGIASDVSLASYNLPPGSILLITVDIKPPEDRQGPREWMNYFSTELEMYFEHNWDEDDFSQSSFPYINFHILLNAIKQGIAGREDIRFIQLFKFLYADGHPMLTLGGIIGATKEANSLQRCNLDMVDFIRLDSKQSPYEIVVPRLTRKERFHLDYHMPCQDGWLPDEFELSSEEVMNYRSIYRFYPLYAELLI